MSSFKNLKHWNNRTLSEMTDGYLTQKTLINDDFLALTYEGFERILIFDRKPHNDKLAPDTN